MGMMDTLFDGSDAHLLPTAGRLPWDVARCTGDNADGVCKMRYECRRFTERENAGPVTLHFEAPIDGNLETGCELLIAEPDH